MKNTTIDTPAKVGCPSFRIEVREVFSDQVDALGTDCLHCSLEDRQVTVNLYVRHEDGESELLHCCVPCVVGIVLDKAVDLDCNHAVIAEFAQVAA
jgi:hypothetical protein